MSELKEKMKSYNELCTLEKEIIGKIIEQVESIEEIPVCKNLSSNSIIFTISSRDLSTTSWDPAYYTNAIPKADIVEKIRKMDSLPKVIAFIDDVCKNKKVDIGKQKYVCNDYFISALKKILDELK